MRAFVQNRPVTNCNCSGSESREKLIQIITSNAENRLSIDYLNSQPLEALQGIAELAKGTSQVNNAASVGELPLPDMFATNNSATKANYSGQATPLPQRSSSNDVGELPLPNMFGS